MVPASMGVEKLWDDLFLGYIDALVLDVLELKELNLANLKTSKCVKFIHCFISKNLKTLKNVKRLGTPSKNYSDHCYS